MHIWHRRMVRYVAVALVALPATQITLRAPDVGAHRAAAEVDGPNILVNGGFEQGADPGNHLELPVGMSPFLAGWTVVNRYAEYVGSYWRAEEGTRSVGLLYDGNGVLANASGIQQSFPTTIGQRYRTVFYQSAISTQPTIVRFTIAGQSRNFTYQIGPTDTLAKLPWVKRDFVFTATSASTTIEFQAFYTKGWWIALDNVQVRAIQPPASDGTPTPGTGPLTGAVTLQLAAPALPASGRQTVQGVAGKDAAVALVADYPDGTQWLASLRAGPDGRYSDTWAVPPGVHGLVHILVDSAGTSAHGSFTVQ